MLRIPLAVLVFIAAPAVAEAADVIAVPIESTGQSVPLSDGATDWNGFYVGIYGASHSDATNGSQVGLGLGAGVNAQIDFVLVGAEVSLQGLTGDSVDTAYGQIVGRGGLILNDDVLLYAAAGYGWDLAASEGELLAGGGVELSLTRDISLNAQYLRGFDRADDSANDQVTLGARFHF